MDQITLGMNLLLSYVDKATGRENIYSLKVYQIINKLDTLDLESQIIFASSDDRTVNLEFSRRDFGEVQDAIGG